jgi:hypothetical protein
MALSGFGMRKTKMGKYKIAETFYDIRYEEGEV